MRYLVSKAKIANLKKGRAVWLALLLACLAALSVVFGCVFGLVNRGNDFYLMIVGPILCFLLLAFSSFALFAKIIPYSRLAKVLGRYLNCPFEAVKGEIAVKEELAMRELSPCRIYEVTVKMEAPYPDKHFEAAVPVAFDEALPKRGTFYLHNAFLLAYSEGIDEAE